MKQLIILLLVCTALQWSSCFIIPIFAQSYVLNMDNEVFDKGLIGDFEGERDNLTYNVTIEPKGYRYKGRIVIVQEKDTIDQCTFSHIDNELGSGIGKSGLLFCTKDSVQGVFSMQLDHKATSLTIFGVSANLDLAIPNNLTLIKKIHEK